MNVVSFLKGFRPDKLLIDCTLRVQSSTSVKTPIKPTLSMELKEVQIAFKTKVEREGKVVNLGVEGTNFNGHKKEIDKEGRMIETH
jgi:hypothetical protein